MNPRWHTEDLVKLLQRLTLGLGNEEKNEHETDQIPDGVEGEGALLRECLPETGPSDREDKVEEPGSRGSCKSYS